MRQANVFLHFIFGIVMAFLNPICVQADDPYSYHTWTVTSGTISPLGVPQKGILINGQFPGPTVDCVTNDNIVVNVINMLNEPFLITWNGINQRKTSWQDGVLGTNCPIPPGTNWTYNFQTKDQIGTFTYFASTLMHRAGGAFGAFNVASRSIIPIPYPTPDAEFTLLIGDWYKANYLGLRRRLDKGLDLPVPKALLINGQANGVTFTGQPGKTYRFRVSNVGIATSINLRIQGHNMLLVEVEGCHVIQEVYQSLDIHVGQSVAVLVTLNAPPKDYYIVASTRFTNPVLKVTGILHYDGSNTPPSLPLPAGPTNQFQWSMKQARTIRTNLTANAARPNPQGSYHYGTIPIARTQILQNVRTKINGKLRFAVNSISYVDPATPLKLADWYNIPGVFTLNSTTDSPTNTPPFLGVGVIGTTLHDFVEIVFQNTEKALQTWHFDGYRFYVVGYGQNSVWTPAMRKRYNMNDAVSRCTVQVYPLGWSAILVSLDNKGMWNLRSAIWHKRYLGQQIYVRVWNSKQSLYTENNIPSNALFCGLAKHP